MGSATLPPPWLTPWSSGLVFGQPVYKAGVGGEEYSPPDRTRHRSRLTIFTYGHENAPILRLGSWEPSGVGAGGRLLAYGAPGGASAAPPALAPGLRWERVPIDHAPWNVDVPVPVEPPQYRPPRYNLLNLHGAEYEEGAGSRSARDGAPVWEGPLRGWVAGAALLALVVMIARTAERCFDWWVVRRRRRRRQEWQRATANCPDDDVPADRSGMGFPPPYSACSPAVAVPKPPSASASPTASASASAGAGEPPPPYSDSCVQFVNKNGVPVLVYSRNRLGQDGSRDEVCVDIPQGGGDEHEVGRILEACGIHVNRTAAVTDEESEQANEDIVLIHENTTLPHPPAGFTDSPDNSVDSSPVHVTVTDTLIHTVTVSGHGPPGHGTPGHTAAVDSPVDTTAPGNTADQPADVRAAYEVVNTNIHNSNETDDIPRDLSVVA